MHTNSQKYAQKAYKDVTAVQKDKNDDYHKKYATMAHRLPVLIHTAGLTQALAFVEAKSQNEPAWEAYFNHVAEALEKADGNTLFLESQTAELEEYILLTKRVNDVVVWYKRFAESVLKIDASQADSESTGSASEGDGT